MQICKKAAFMLLAIAMITFMLAGSSLSPIN